jgi:regulator of replication initiation timing
VTFRTIPGLPPQFEMKTEGEKWQGAFKAAQGAIREQGQVMSAALDNNRSLWETNKKLRRERMDILETCARLERERNDLERKLADIPGDVQERAALQNENNALRSANATLRAELGRMLTPELDTDALRARMEDLKKQGAELRATGLVPTQEEIDAHDAKLQQA